MKRIVLRAIAKAAVTNGFRSAWGTDLFVGVRSIIDTGRYHDLTPFQAIRNTLDARSVVFAA